MIKYLCLFLASLQLVQGGALLRHGDVIKNDARCPTFDLANWANPGNYFGTEVNCHAFRVCDRHCDSTLMCCPVVTNADGEVVDQLIWDDEACECVLDDGKTGFCQDDLCEGFEEIPFFPRPDTFDPNTCWRNGILYETAASPVHTVNDLPVSYYIRQPDVPPFQNSVIQFCPSLPAEIGLANYTFQQWFDLDACACLGSTKVPEPEEPYCVHLDSESDKETGLFFDNQGNDPASLALTHRGMMIRDDGYYFSGLEGTCIEFPYFKNQPFWYRGFSIWIFSLRGTGIVASNYNADRVGTFELTVESTADQSTFTARLENLRTEFISVVVPRGIENESFSWSIHIHFSFTLGKFTLVAIAHSDGAGADIVRRADGFIVGGEFSLRDCPLAFGCDETSTNNFVGTMGRIQMECDVSSVAEDSIVNAGP